MIPGRDGGRKDDNSVCNGILLRRDIHALFDAFLITVTDDGGAVEVSEQVTDPCYRRLAGSQVYRPTVQQAPAKENIAAHREFYTAFETERCEKRA